MNEEKRMLEIIPIDPNRRNEALELVLNVFMQFESPDYSPEGVASFKAFLSDAVKITTLEFYGAYIDGSLAGVIATRNAGNHIALLFVDGRWHRQGIGRKLFEEALKHSTLDTITVNSSPYAVEVYKKLGFEATDPEQMVDGIRFTPMIYKK